MPSSPETRQVLFLTYSHNDADEASVLDVSGSLEDARWEAKEAGRGGFIYRLERLPSGEYGNETFVEQIH